MSFQNTLNQIEHSDDFRQWRERDSSSYLVHVFAMVQEGNSAEWHFGYYDPERDRITTFSLIDKRVNMAEDEAFKESGAIERLELDKLKIRFDAANEAVEKLRKEKYPSEIVNKSIFILQTLNKAMLWNVTLVTQSFSLINIKLDAVSGEILSDTKGSVMNLKMQ